MKVFILCRTGHHTSLLAAGMMLGIIDQKSDIPDKAVKVRGYDDIGFKEIGTPFFVGNDVNNNEIFTIGIARESTVMERAVKELIRLMDIEPQDRKIVNVSGAVSRWTRVGLILKGLHLNSLARVFFYLGVRSEVDRVSRILKESDLQPV